MEIENFLSFAGGYISARFTQLGMQNIVADLRVEVHPVQSLTIPALC